jgi:Flp pilus assembly protein TadG
MEKTRKTLHRRGRFLFRSAAGQSLVETAVLGSLLILVLLGVVEFGQVAYDSIEVSNAAMAGAQYGGQNGLTANDATGISNAAEAAAPDLSALSVTSSRTCVCSDGTASTCSIGDCSSSFVEPIVTVNTTATITPAIHLPGLTSFTLKGKAIQKCVGQQFN